MPPDKVHVLATVHRRRGHVEQAIKAAGEAGRTGTARRGKNAPPSSSEPRSCSPARGARHSTPPPCWAIETAHQAEIDAACELTYFFRFNVQFMLRIYGEQPSSAPGTWNRMEYRPLEGFVFAVTPFNFTAIGGNLPGSAALMGNTVVWKPASTAAYSAHFLMKLFEAAGLPPGVINLVYGSGAEIGDPALASRDLAGVHFTGSTPVFQSMWKTIGSNIANYRNYPRIVGETGGKDFIVAHPSADAEAVATAIVRGSFEYQAKMLAASRVFAPSNSGPRSGSCHEFARSLVASPIFRISWRSERSARSDARDASRRQRRRQVESSSARYYYSEFTSSSHPARNRPNFRTLRDELFGPSSDLRLPRGKVRRDAH